MSRDIVKHTLGFCPRCLEPARVSLDGYPAKCGTKRDTPTGMCYSQLLTDSLVKDMAAGRWTPPVRAYPKDEPDHGVLLEHHERETKLLMEMVRGLATLLAQKKEGP